MAPAQGWHANSWSVPYLKKKKKTLTRDLKDWWFLTYVSTGRRFKGKGKGNKAAQAGSAKGKVQFQGKKTKFDSDDERDENGASRKFF